MKGMSRLILKNSMLTLISLKECMFPLCSYVY
jgi:hypothetical protein